MRSVWSLAEVFQKLAAVLVAKCSDQAADQQDQNDEERRDVDVQRVAAGHDRNRSRESIIPL